MQADDATYGELLLALGTRSGPRPFEAAPTATIT